MHTRNQQMTRQVYAKAARRPLLFWWQVFVFLGIAVLLWYQFPSEAIFYTPRTLHPLPAAQAAYVILDPDEAMKMMRGSFMNWTLGGHRHNGEQQVEFGMADLTDLLPAPVFWEQKNRYPGAWQPSAISPLPVQPRPIQAPSAAVDDTAQPLPVPPAGIRLSLAQSLQAVSFTVTLPDTCFAERAGNSRFYVETNDAGLPEHILLLSPRTPASTALIRRLMSGRATGAARGFVDIHWNLP